MIELQLLRQNPELIKQRLAIKHFQQTEVVDTIVKIDENRRVLQQQLDEKLNRSNKIAQEVGMLYKSGKAAEAESLKAEAVALKEEVRQMEDQLRLLEQEQEQMAVLLPNLPNANVPEGKTPEDNRVVKQYGAIPTLFEQAKPHWELMEQLQLVSLSLGTKITGAGFPVYIGKGARLQRALIAFFLDEAATAGYTEYIPPLMVNSASAFGTGQLPDKEGQMYHITQDELYMIPTAEVPLTNIYRDEILDEAQLPVKLVGYTPCFRREAGSYGAHVRGLNRVHQFDKVEIVQIQTPENSYAALEEMVRHVEGLLQKLELPYRILALCGGDMSFASAFTYDFEVFSAAQQRWLEVSSVSNFETFQSNRLKLRFREAGKKTRLAHTLNGSALALARIVASLLENHQQPDGSIAIPKALQPYTGFAAILPKE